MARRRRWGRIILFFAILVGGFALFLFSKRLVHRPNAAPEHAAGGGSAESDDEPDAIAEDGRRYKVRSWSFPLARFEMRVEDTAMTTALDTVMTKTSAELVVNGGFFGPDGKAVGLVVSKGAVLSRFSKQMSGGVLTSNGDQASLFAAESFDLTDGGDDAASVQFAIQCKPRLVVGSKPNVKSDDGKRAERSALCLRDAGKTVDVYIVRGSDDGESAGPSLFALARFLARAGCEGALNLDGGPSTGAAWHEDGGVQLLAPRASVRHVVAFVERH